LPSLGTANTEDNLVNEQSVNDNAINQNISQIVPEYVLCECAEKYQFHHTTCFSFGLFVFLGLTGGILKNKVQTHNTM
jgi:hypothetical protein